jgi:hypothetical protein
LASFARRRRDLGLAHAGRPDHQDVLRIDLLAQVIAQLLAPPAVPERHGHGALGVLLPDDEAVELRDDFAGGEIGQAEVSLVQKVIGGQAGPCPEKRAARA